MTQKTIERFLEYASMKMPDLVRPANEQTKLREVYDDYALLVFHLPHPLTVEELQEIADECHGLTLIYHHMRSRQTDFGQSVCLFQEPGTGVMFQLDGTTNGYGRISHVDVKVFSSMERMAVELRQQLRRAADIPGEFASRLQEDELITYFL